MKKVAAIALLLSLAVAAGAQEAPKKYEIKSGMAKTVSEVMGQKTETMSFFDNYGALEATNTKANIPGMGEMEITTIARDGKMYIVNHTAKKVQEVPAQASVNYLNLTDEIVKKYKIVNVGKESVGERECSKYTMEMSQMGQTASLTVWVWKGYPVKTVTSMGGMNVVAEVVEFVEDAYMLPQTFEVPKF